MITLRPFVCAVLISTAGAGCGGGGSGGIALDNLGAEVSKASCAKIFECCDGAEIMEEFEGITVSGQPITTEAQCVQFTSALVAGFLTQAYKDSIAKGRIEYDGEAAAGCMAAIEAASCGEYSMQMSIDAPPGCESFVIPLVAEGGGCTQDYECTTDNCDGAMVIPGEPGTDGTCKPRSGLGQECRSDNCVDGAFCEFGSMAGKSICKAQKADGQPCTFDEQCTSERCSGDSQSPGTCGAGTPRCDGA